MDWVVSSAILLAKLAGSGLIVAVAWQCADHIYTSTKEDFNPRTVFYFLCSIMALLVHRPPAASARRTVL
jgi:hypothetical protein